MRIQLSARLKVSVPRRNNIERAAKQEAREHVRGVIKDTPNEVVAQERKEPHLHASGHGRSKRVDARHEFGKHQQ